MTQKKPFRHTLILDDYWHEFITNQISKGRFASASQVVEHALRLMEASAPNPKLQALRAALMEGQESGDAGPLDMQSIINEAKREQ